MSRTLVWPTALISATWIANPASAQMRGEIGIAVGETPELVEIEDLDGNPVSLADFAGERGSGVWTLEVIDDNESDDGSVVSWSLDVSLSEATALTQPDDLGTPSQDETGEYDFENLVPGTYEVHQVLQGGWTQIAPAVGHTATLNAGEQATGLDFANQQ